MSTVDAALPPAAAEAVGKYAGRIAKRKNLSPPARKLGVAIRSWALKIARASASNCV